MVAQPFRMPEIMSARVQLPTLARVRQVASATTIAGQCRLSTQPERPWPKQAQRRRFRLNRSFEATSAEPQGSAEFACQWSVVAKHFIVADAAASGCFRAV